MVPIQATPDGALLRQLLHYDPLAGTFTWRPRAHESFNNLRAFAAWNARYANRVAGGMTGGYWAIRIDGCLFYAHRLAWLYVHDRLPAGDIDHRNGVTTDNRIRNLRDVTVVTNHENIRARPGGGPLPLGVHFLARKVQRPYSASIRIGGRSKHLGYFDTAEVAHLAYVAAKRIHHAGCTI